jgi:cell division protein ZapD
VLVILYEYPFHERIRTLLRLENLFEKFRFFVDQPHPLTHHAALVSLFEMTDLASRGDLRADLLQELGRQRAALELFRDNPEIAQDKLDEVLVNVEALVQALMQQTERFGLHLRDIEWLNAVRNRLSVPGGVCDFDVPAHHAWLSLPPESRSQELLAWVSPLSLAYDALTLVLKLLRESGVRSRQLAIQGSYQYMFAGRQYQLMQLLVDDSLGVIPEFSVNKYMVWIRFMVKDGGVKFRPAEKDVPFELIFCNA